MPQYHRFSSPSQLYRAILKAHQVLFLSNAEMKAMGDTYVQAEFRLHRKATPAQAAMFLESWEGYYQHLMQQGNISQQQIDIQQQEEERHVVRQQQTVVFGKDLPPNVNMSDEQKMQLEKLREETIKAIQQEGSAS